ncbi:MAG: papain-like cysteine protease family protein [Syntrophomonadaceae bacterium]|nr:papain-like cysteine protease family protein [Syntrophomonadaceae bacterium]
MKQTLNKPFKRTSVLLVTILFLFICVSSVLATRVVLSVPNYSQQPYDSLCWATSASMVISFFLDDTTDRKVEIAQSEFGNDDFNYGSWNMEPYVENYTNIAGTTRNNALSYTAVKYQTNNDGPIISVIQYSDNSTHAEVIKGYDTSTNFVLFNDPWDGDSHGATYSYYLSNSNWDWIWSLFWR